MIGVLHVCAVLIAACPQTGRAQASSPRSPFGTEVRLTTDAREVRGELLAVGSDSLWIQTDSLTVALARLDLRTVRYRRHSFGRRRAHTIGFGISGATTLGIAMACSSTENANCGGVAVGWLAVTSALTLVSGALANGADWQTLPPEQWDQLGAHARFPQGLPRTAPTQPQPPPI
jgi:hypothetical protein